MRFEERLNELISEAEVPDELSPQNIARMLKAQSEQPKMIAEHRNIKAAPNISAQRRTIIMRTAAAAAACTVFAAGMLAYNGKRAEQEMLDDRISYEAVSPDSYDELYKIYTGINLNGGDTDSEIPDTDRTVEDDIRSENGGEVPGTGGEPIERTTAPKEETFTDSSSYDFTDYTGENISEADITKCDEKYMYCLKGSTLYIVSLETMEVVSTIESTLDPPVEIYIEGDRVILISRETEEIQIISGGTDETVTDVSSDTENTAIAPDVPAGGANIDQSEKSDSDNTEEAVLDDETGQANAASTSPTGAAGSTERADSAKTASRANTVVDIYDVGDAAAPVKTTSYKQNGSYMASRLVDGTLYMVTEYSDYRVKPLDTQADLDSFVPAYYIDGEKHYLEASDITVPAGANSTDYTVVSAIGIGDGVVSAAVKAVLGSNGSVYCSADTMYTVGVGKKDIEYSIISAFDLSEGGISYRTSGSVEGAVLGQQSMNEYDGKFRIASKTTDKNGSTTISVYVLDRSLTVINSAGQLLPDKKVAAVRFENNYARLFEEDGTVTVLDIASTPPTLSQSPIGGSAFLYGFGDSLLAVGEADGGGMTLTMYSSENSLILDTVTFADDVGKTYSKALTDRRAALIDTENKIIGIPVYSYNEFGTKNQYFVYCCDSEAGFVLKGVIEYVDIDDSLIFERGELKGDKLYIISKGRIISARSSDLKVIGSYEY